MRKSWTESESEDEETYYKAVYISERPNHKSKAARDERSWRDHDDFMMDFENWCLGKKWDSYKSPHPTGKNRYENKNWADMIQKEVYPYHSDVDWFEYVEWVQNGGGDEYFME